MADKAAHTPLDTEDRNPVAVRLRAVELAHRFDREPKEVLRVAAVYADWILEGAKPRQSKADKSPGGEPAAD